MFEVYKELLQTWFLNHLSCYSEGVLFETGRYGHVLVSDHFDESVTQLSKDQLCQKTLHFLLAYFFIWKELGQEGWSLFGFYWWHELVLGPVELRRVVGLRASVFFRGLRLQVFYYPVVSLLSFLLHQINFKIRSFVQLDLLGKQMLVYSLLKQKLRLNRGFTHQLHFLHGWLRALVFWWKVLLVCN